MAQDWRHSERHAQALARSSRHRAGRCLYRAGGNAYFNSDDITFSHGNSECADRHGWSDRDGIGLSFDQPDRLRVGRANVDAHPGSERDAVRRAGRLD